MIPYQNLIRYYILNDQLDYYFPNLNSSACNSQYQLKVALGTNPQLLQQNKSWKFMTDRKWLIYTIFSLNQSQKIIQNPKKFLQSQITKEELEVLKNLDTIRFISKQQRIFTQRLIKISKDTKNQVTDQQIKELKKQQSI
ncbi:unnamed protein product [Paramecium primaurelia]|uniref:Uncharacterized protein n=1 Tax=Paramecium primaurelia TaxID=5886 RepID=A0A8S1JQZ1_PARPR|nr:unnamed protein product [Paramecium primaurelia]